jgi:hypothetical protein
MVHKAGQQMSHQLGSGDDAWSGACGFPRVPLYGVRMGVYNVFRTRKGAMGGERWVDRGEMPGATMAVLDVVRE